MARDHNSLVSAVVMSIWFSMWSYGIRQSFLSFSELILKILISAHYISMKKGHSTIMALASAIFIVDS